MIRILIFYLYFINLGNTIQTSQEKLIFDIIHRNKVIGILEATKINNNAKTYYKSSTTINTRIIKDIEVNYKYDVTFNTNFLTSSNVSITVNEKLHTKTVTKWNKNSYQVIKNRNKENSIKDTITYSTIQLYFKEPRNISKCFSEQNGKFNSIIAMGNHIYKKVNPKGNQNLYYYENGLLKKADINGGLIHFKIIKKQTIKP
ncbi:hypothetical protein MC378_04100 [Polaribacter sp. MSW13]|uniref:Uncharacterized protein n=1 Tax=Polaribacter marinus TaxID=2916838 RepID=A0A9X1VKU2_9FLAO|nr:DUF6134 family protein [Polaribacter marinus]MCI2228339.1 hypothetical protein [Polaribacter marinus]